jgi:hypothetical protein
MNDHGATSWSHCERAAVQHQPVDKRYLDLSSTTKRSYICWDYAGSLSSQHSSIHMMVIRSYKEAHRATATTSAATATTRTENLNVTTIKTNSRTSTTTAWGERDQHSPYTWAYTNLV